MRICIVANSVGLKIRPHRASGDDATYAELLRKDGHEIFNGSRAGVTLHECFSVLDDEVVARSPDAVIINHGIIEIYPRRTFRVLNNTAIRNYYLNSKVGKPYRFRTITSETGLLVLRAMNGMTRRIAGLMGLHWRWQTADRFLEVLDACCARVLKETNATVLVMGLSPASAKALVDFPGFAGEIEKVNAALRDYCQRDPDRLRFADVETMLAGMSIQEAIPDGIHFSATAHRRVHDWLSRMLAAPRTGRC